MSRSQVPVALPIIWMALNRLLVEGNHVRTQLGLKALVTNSPIGVQHLPSDAVAIGEGHPVGPRGEVRESEYAMLGRVLAGDDRAPGHAGNLRDRGCHLPEDSAFDECLRGGHPTILGEGLDQTVWHTVEADDNCSFCRETPPHYSVSAWLTTRTVRRLSDLLSISPPSQPHNS